MAKFLMIFRHPAFINKVFNHIFSIMEGKSTKLVKFESLISETSYSATDKKELCLRSATTPNYSGGSSGGSSGLLETPFETKVFHFHKAVSWTTY